MGALLVLESGVSLDTGAGSAVLFNRQAYVGLSSKSLGTLSLGRQYGPIHDLLIGLSGAPALGVQAGAIDGIAAPGSTSSVARFENTTGSTRFDNSVQYTSPTVSGFKRSGRKHLMHDSHLARVDAQLGAKAKAQRAPGILAQTQLLPGFGASALSGVGGKRACSRSSGLWACCRCRRWTASTGPGWPRWRGDPEPAWEGKKSAPTPADRGKGGVKRSLLTEARGIPLAVVVEGANRHGMKLAEATLTALMLPRPTPRPDKPQGPCLDKGGDY